MEQVLRVAVLGVGLLLLSWALLAFLAKRLPPGTAKDLATVLPVEQAVAAAHSVTLWNGACPVRSSRR